MNYSKLPAMVTTPAGRALMLKHLVRGHGVSGELRKLTMQELIALWWLHGHREDEAEQFTCPLQVKAQEVIA